MDKIWMKAAAGAHHARQLVEDLNIQRASEIKIELIAAHYGISIEQEDLEQQDGMLLRVGDEGSILVTDRAFSSKQWRFVVAHELGHFFLHQDVNQLSMCTHDNLYDWYQGSGNETEANAFAAELLMPEKIFLPYCDRNMPSLNDISEIAKVFDTSLSSTALRFVKLAPEPCAVAYSENKRIKWWATNDDFKFYLKRGYQLDNNSYAGDLFDGKSMPVDKPLSTSGSAWSDFDWADIDICEHSQRLGTRGVLSILWHEY